MWRGRNLKQAYEPSGSSLMPSASPCFDFFQVILRFPYLWVGDLLLLGLYITLFLQSALQSFLSPYCVPCLPSPATVIGFGGGGASFPRKKKILFLIWGTFWGFTFVSTLLAFLWSRSLRPPVTFCFSAPSQTCAQFSPTSVLKSHRGLWSGPTCPAGSLCHLWAPSGQERGMGLGMSSLLRDFEHRSYQLHLELHLRGS